MTRRILLLVFIPASMGIVVSGTFGFQGFLATWCVCLALWIPSSLVRLRAMMQPEGHSDPMALPQADGSLWSRQQVRASARASAWEQGTMAWVLPLLGLGVWPVSQPAAVGFATFMCLPAGMLTRMAQQRLSVTEAWIALESEQLDRATSILEGLVSAPLVAPALRQNILLMWALAMARLGQVEAAMAVLAEVRHDSSPWLSALLHAGQGDFQPGQELLRAPLSDRSRTQYPRAVLAVLVDLDNMTLEGAQQHADGWRELRAQSSRHSARFLDLLEAVAFMAAGDRSRGLLALRRAEQHDEHWPWLEHVYPRVASLRGQLHEATGEGRHE